MKKRVKLITLPWELEVPTLSLASLAAVTPQRWFDVAIVDVLRERLHLDEPVDLVGISASTPSIKAAYALADAYRARGARVVLGGHHVTALPEEGLEHAHAVVCGEGETSWMRICDQLLRDPRLVEGIYHDPAPDLATLPIPRTDLMKIHRYQPYYYPIIATRGCPQHCSFCFAKRMTRGYRTHPIRYVLEQVRRRPKWIKAIYFVDDNLAGDLEYTHELFRQLRRYNVPFGMQVRHEFSQDDRNLALAKEAGCVLVSSGYESVNQKTLDGTGKRANADLYQGIITNIQDRGMMASGNWMFGFDWDTPDIFEETWDFLRRSNIYHSSFTVEIPFPGTPSFKKYKREGRLLTEDYDRYTGKGSVVYRPKNMTPEQLRDGIRWLARKYYSLGHRHRLGKLGVANEKLFDQFTGWRRTAALMSLNYFQVWQWLYRTEPSLQWLYARMLKANKYRYVSDLFRNTNFWGTGFGESIPAETEWRGDSPFMDRTGEMSPGQDRLTIVP